MTCSRGAACEAAKEGIPSIAFSGTSTSQVSFTTLETSPSSAATQAALIYSQLTITLTRSLLASSTRPILPANTTLNVNYPSTSGCSSASDFSFVFTRNVASSSATDVTTCGTDHLPDETTVVHSSGCHVSISVISAITKTDVDATTQEEVLQRISNLLTCFS
jgi:5'-nucleotidase